MVSVANTVLNQWGPALLVCFTVIIGLFYQNSRMNDLNKQIDDLRSDFNMRIDDLKSDFNNRIDDLKESINHRIDALEKRFEDRMDVLESRMDRLQSPLIRK